MSQTPNTHRAARLRSPLNVMRRLRMRAGTEIDGDDLTEFFGEDLSDENERFVETFTRGRKESVAC